MNTFAFAPFAAWTALSPAFCAGLALSLSLIMAIGPQNAHVLRMGMRGQYLWLTVAVSVLADMALIALGVMGLGQLGGLSDKLEGALMGAGVLFLLVYGAQAARRCWQPAPARTVDAAPADQSMNWRRAVGAALAFSWLNPHAWIDTAVLLGTASLAYGTPGKQVFGVGAAAGSLLWFVCLGVLVVWLGRRIESAAVWRALDGLVALMMWGTALSLVSGLFKA